MSWPRTIVDPGSVRRRVAGRCFVCELLAGAPEFAHHVFYEDERTVAFLNAYPTLYGYSLVAPKQHVTEVTADFDLEQYLALQRVVYRVAEAIRALVPAERIYILSLGSAQRNAHVHWHVAPLPPGIPFEQQQFAALDWTHGFLDIPQAELGTLASRLRTSLRG